MPLENSCISKSRSDPDSKQKTKTELTFWYVLPDCIHSKPLSRETETEKGLYSHVWMCDYLLTFVTKCDQICFAKKTKRNTYKQSQIRDCDILRMSQIVTNCHTLMWASTYHFHFRFHIKIPQWKNRTITFLSFFLSWVSKTQPNHWIQRMPNTRLTT